MYQYVEKAKKLIIKYRHAWVLLYGLIYMPWFTYLERHVRTDYYLIHSPLDDYIPFVEYFIVPYFLWFLFIAATVAYFFFTDRKGFYRLCTFLFSGMTVFLIVCTFSPTGWICVPQSSPGIISSQRQSGGSTGRTRPRMCCQHPRV